MNETTQLCTFPNNDKDYCKCFTVPTDWLEELLGTLDSLNERKGVDLENFLENYVWDETWFIYMQAVAENKLIDEVEQR